MHFSFDIIFKKRKKKPLCIGMRAVFAIDEEESEEEAGRSRSPERSPRRAPQPPLTPQPPPTPPPPQALAPLKLVKQPSELFIVSHGKLGIELGVDHETMSMLITNVSDDGAVADGR